MSGKPGRKCKYSNTGLNIMKIECPEVTASCLDMKCNEDTDCALYHGHLTHELRYKERMVDK